MKIIVIGGGAAGLHAASCLLKSGFEVSLHESESELGGLASWFKIEDHYLERYYHFLCLNDLEYLEVCRELGLAQDIHWKRVRMGHFYNGKRYCFGAPWDLLVFPHLSWSDKLKFGLAISKMKRAPFSAWRDIAAQPAVPWLRKTFGERVFEIIHAPLISGKFGEYQDNLSAAWVWARMHRVGKSRSRFLNLEIYGYLEGGSYRLLQALATRVKNMGGRIATNSPVLDVHMDQGKVSGVRTKEGFEACDAVISTIPFQLLRKLVPIDHPYFHALDNAEYYGVTCLVLRTRRPLTQHYWLNINDPRIENPGLIEYTNLNPLPYLGGDRLIYIPHYLDPKDPRFERSHEELRRRYLAYLQIIDPRFRESDITETYLFKNTHAQPLCDLGFHERIPDKRTPVRGLYVTDSYQLHPDDRTVSASLKMGREAAEYVSKDMMR